MTGNEARPETTPVRPVVFAGVGHSAVATVLQLPRAAADLRIRVAGPFGLAVAREPEGPLFILDRQWLSDLELPELSGDAQAAPRLTDPDDALVSTFRALTRRLRVDRPNIASGTSPHIRVCAYVVIDLATPGAVPAGLRLAGLLSQTDSPPDITGLVLTGRTAESLSEPDEPWLEAFRQLLTSLQRQSPLNRLYVLDGRDTNHTWLQTLGQMQRLGAEFLLHHGVSPYRAHLRRSEEGRLNGRQDYLHVCGSFSCRTLRSDRTAVARGIAAQLKDDLADLNQGVLTDERAETLCAEAKQLSETIVQIHQTDSDQDDQTRTASQRDQKSPRERALRDALKATLTRVCTKQPVLSLREFLKCLRPLLNQLSTSSGLSERVETRYHIADILRKQRRDTYGPARIWLHEPGVYWKGLYQLSVPPDYTSWATVSRSWAAVSRPARMLAYWLGLLLLAIGLTAILLAAAWQNVAPAILGGVLALGGSAVGALPSGWVQRKRTLVPKGKRASDRAPGVAYRLKAPASRLMLAAALLAAGLIAVAWALSVVAWTGGQATYAALLTPLWLVVVMGGFALQAWPRQADEPGDAVREREMPQMLGPPAWGWRITGLIGLAIAWAGLCSLAPETLMSGGLWRWAGLVAGLLLILGGVAVGRWPSVAHKPLVRHIPKKPVPLISGLAKPVKESELTAQVRGIIAWVDALPAESKAATTDDLDWSEPQSDGNILDALVENWQQRLADAFRRTLPSTSTNPMAELAEQPEHWAKALLAEMANPTLGLADPAYLFSLHAVEDWMSKRPWPQLVAELRPDPQWFDFFVDRICAPHWPPTRSECEVDVSIIAVGDALWETVAPLAQAKPAHRLLPVAWHDPHTLVVIRIVQGLLGGWRNFPPLPDKEDPASETRGL